MTTDSESTLATGQPFDTEDARFEQWWLEFAAAEKIARDPPQGYWERKLIAWSAWLGCAGRML